MTTLRHSPLPEHGAGREAAPVETAACHCVVIGRNEAARLRECLESVLPGCRRVVYVDSGSTDGSAGIARSFGIPVIELDPSLPFSAARARNEGFACLNREGGAVIDHVQFVDGDCTLERGWLTAAVRALDHDRTLAAVTGLVREQSARSSVYNLLCEIELAVPAGEIEACGGVVMMRASALQAAGGFDSTLVAGEEPELCLRLRRLGWRLECLPVPMMRHDVDMHSFRQWWARNRRSGRAYFESWWKHRAGPEAFRAREVARILAWGALVPLLTLVAVLAFGSYGLSCAIAEVWPGSRAYRWAKRRGRDRRDSAVYAIACVVGKVPECAGVLESWSRCRWRPRRLVALPAPASEASVESGDGRASGPAGDPDGDRAA
jgi:GT2 family glycosyltransferase